jgi:hypothetical protein
MALAIDTSTPAFVGTTATAVATLTTASFTPPSGSLLVVTYIACNDSGLQTSPTNTGGTVSWDATAKATNSSAHTGVSIWLGTVTSSAAMTVTANRASHNSWGFGCAVITGQAATQNGATQPASAASGGTITDTITSLVGANSLVLAPISVNTNNFTPTIPAGQSDVWNGNTYILHDTSNFASGWIQYLTGMNLAAGASATINDTAPTSVEFSMAMLEILAASAGPTNPAIGPQIISGHSTYF